MRIAFLITDMTGVGGIERVTQCLANAFTGLKEYDVSIISCFKRNNSHVYPINPKIQIHYILNRDYNLKNRFLNRALLITKCVTKLKRLLKKNEFDIIITQAFLPTLILYLTGTKSINVICEHFKYELYSHLMTRLRNAIYHKAGYVVTLTDADQRKFKDAGITTVTIPNMLSYPIYRGEYHNGKRLTAIGRLHPQKGFDLLIDALGLIFKKHPDWHCDIFGEGEERDSLQNQITESGLSDNISLKGYSSNIRLELQQSDICLVTSRYEGFPMAIIEALSSGVPVVSFDCPEGPATLLKNDAGILVENGNITEFAHAVNKLIEDTSFRLKCRENGYRNIEEYEPEKILQRWQEFFKTV